METKVCSKCKKEKPNTNEYFAFRNKSKGILKSSCKTCDKEYRKNNKERIRESKKVYAERNKVRLKEYFKEYYKNNRCKIMKSTKEYQENNKEKVREYKKEYRNRDKTKNMMKEYLKEYKKNNKDKLNEYFKEYQKNNKDKMIFYSSQRRALRAGNGGSYTQEQRTEMLEYFNYKCAYTGKCIENNLHVDHITPVTKGGSNYIYNLVPATPSANMSKGNKDMEEWYREQPYFSEDRLNKIYEYMEYMKNKFQ